MPIYILFFLRHLPLAEVLWLEGIYYAAVFALELPSGYFSDRVGRRPTLLIASVCYLVAYAVFPTSNSFFGFAVAQIFLACGVSFVSGTNTSLHYDSLLEAGKAHEYAGREARVTQIGFYSSAVAALVGGFAAMFDLRVAYALSLCIALLQLLTVIALAEPLLTKNKTSSRFFEQLSNLLQTMQKSHSLQWMFFYATAMIVLNHIPYEFYQPYIGLIAEDNGVSTTNTPQLTGFHMFVTMVVGGWFSARSMLFCDKAGIRNGLIVAAMLQVFLIATMSLYLSPVVAGLLLLRSTPRGLMTAPINAAIAPLIPSSIRASYLSLQSLSGRLTFSITLYALGWVSTSDSAWQELQGRLSASLMIGVLCLLIMLLWRPDLSSDEP